MKPTQVNADGSVEYTLRWQHHTQYGVQERWARVVGPVEFAQQCAESAWGRLDAGIDTDVRCTRPEMP